MVAGAHRASVLQRFGAPRDSVVAALPAIVFPDITATQAPPASTSGVHHHSYTGTAACFPPCHLSVLPSASVLISLASHTQ